MLGLDNLLRSQHRQGTPVIPRAIRAVQDQIADFDSCEAIRLVVLDPTDLTRLELRLTPTEGLWKGLTYRFGVQIPASFPEDPPRVRCDDPILHPSISSTGGVCVNILREDYKHGTTLMAISHALMFLLEEPSPVSPLYEFAASLMEAGEFEDAVHRSLRGETINGVQYPKRI